MYQRRRGRPRRYDYPGVPEEPGYYVYEFWSIEKCLYVGRVGNSGPGSMYLRLAGHRSDKSWWPDISQIVVSSFGSHEEIVAEEQRRIYELQPLHNRMYAATCRKGHAKIRGERGCAECTREWQQSPEYRTWQREYKDRPEVKRRMSEHWRSAEYKAWRQEYRARPGVSEREDAYQAAYRERPERIAREQVRQRGRDYDEYNSRPEVKARKRRWANAKSGRIAAPGQAGLW